MSKVLVISLDTIPIKDHLAAGTGIRSWEIAAGLKRYNNDVTIAVPRKCYDSDISENAGVKIKTWDYDNIISSCEGMDAVLIPQSDASLSDFFVRNIWDDLCVIVDVYDPNLIESLNLFSFDEKGVKGFSDYLTKIIPILKRGDFFVCASHRQRYYYLGILNVLGRINPLTYNEKLIEIVPFGVPDHDPVYNEKKWVMRGKIVKEDDLVALWFGGIYPWFDAITLIKAVDKAVRKNSKIKLVIMGAVHPRLIAPPDNYIKTLELAKELGLYNKHVFFTEWRPYEERIYWYRESDVGICTYPVHLETELSNRTRIVDMLWGGLAIITTEGDELSASIKKHNCGETVKPGDAEKLAQILLDIMGDNEKRKKMAENTKILVESLRWTVAVKPLADYLNNPSIAKDRKDEFTANTLLREVDTLERHRTYDPAEKMLLLGKLEEKELQINMLHTSIREKENEIKELQSILNDIYSSFTWTALMKYHMIIEKLFPVKTKRRYYYDFMVHGLRKCSQ